MFVEKNPFRFSFGKMNDGCSVCGLSFNPEPGFYYGAMYVSYGVTIFVSLINFLWMYMLWGFTTWRYLIINAFILFFLIPLIFRLSRSIYLAIIFNVEKSFDKNN